MTVPVRVSVREGNTPTRDPKKEGRIFLGFVLQSANYVQSSPRPRTEQLTADCSCNVVLRSANPVQEDEGQVNPPAEMKMSRKRKNEGRITQYDCISN